MAVPLVAQELLKTKRIFTCSPNHTLSKAASKLESSHDAVFVVENEKLLGVINPYHCLYSSRYPGNTKVSNCLFHPPKLHQDTPINDIATQMLLSKIYFLPVYDDKHNWIGVVSVRRILAAVANFKQIRQVLPKIDVTKKVITINQKDDLSTAYSLLKKGGVSRLPVVNNQGAMVGLLTRYDLKEILTQPEKSPRRFSRRGNKGKKMNQSISSYIQHRVITLPDSANTKELVDLMLEQEVGSIVIVDTNNQPVGIVSYKDILQAVSRVEVA